MPVQAGQPATVAVAVATLWSAPDAVHPVDRPALGPVTDIRAWVAGLAAEQQVRKTVLSQPKAPLHADGYPGWLPVEQLVAPAPAGAASTGAELVVDATATALRDEPDGDVVLAGIVLGTRLAPAGPAFRGWQPVLVPGRPEPLWALARDLAAPPTEPPTAAQALDVAARLLDVTYVWGGVSAYGIDCSGLVHLAWRRLGVTLPRDASDQATATAPLELGEERPGDLYFFARPGRGIHHIGIVTAPPTADGERRMLHACYTSRRVTREPLPPARTATLVAAHRVS